ncbi:OmpH family outer membrane protein [Dysgonomonas sp. 520]|uniref:OmpH family outer membrane protein n=1 Tax=Dysgonomonas sp. 520 TaxID=2302931 RepID=UPI0013D269B9|nr:OmpH family outer membrane protein [Dysgonomonas sp. 520]NDW08779.1 OmpH family outer membrane protein [Dysgonomonas sp. 520]
MKKLTLIFGLLIAFTLSANAQKFALIDMEYILKNIASYETANEQIESLSKRWQSEIDKSRQEIQNLYKTYQSESVFLSADQKKKKEDEIVAKEKALQELNKKYFGPEGELYKQREALINPIQDDIYNAVKEISNAKGYQLVLDRASASSVIFASPRIDISNEVLAKLGYSK